LEEIIGATSVSGATVAAVIWYIKSRIMKYEKKLSNLNRELKESTLDNKVQSEQIKHMKEEIKELRYILFKNQ